MSSLKAFIPQLAEILNMTPAALYERQRVLVRVGLLTPESGRGRGSGVRLSAEAVALLLLSVLVTDSLSEVGLLTREMAEAKADFGHSITSIKHVGRCEVTGKVRLKDAFAEVLDKPELVEKLHSIALARNYRVGTLKFVAPDMDHGTDFRAKGATDDWLRRSSRVRVVSRLEAGDIKEIAKKFREFQKGVGR